MIFWAILGGVILGAAGFYFYDKPRRDVQRAEAAQAAALRQQNAALSTENARLSERVTALESARTQDQAHQAQLDATYKAQFAELASKILDEKSKGLESKNAEVLRPLLLNVESFIKRVGDMERLTAEKQARLEKGLYDVIKSTEKVDQSAAGLANAIKGEAIVRGSWGEEALKRILDGAGMKVGVDYLEQVSEAGKRVDVQIALPGNRWIVVDSKTIFNHYVAYYNEPDPKKKQELLEAHVKDVKKTIRDLSSKSYYEKFQKISDKEQPDYTLMFVYPESALLAAVSKDPDVLQEAWKNNIALVSATSLMSTLKMVSKLWDIDKQHAYMKDWKEDIVKFLEKFNEFLVKFARTENAVLSAAEHIRVARGHIDGDRGGVLPLVQRLVDVYEIPLTPDNARLLKGLKYEYNGRKRRKKSTEPNGAGGEALPAETEVLPGLEAAAKPEAETATPGGMLWEEEPQL